MEYHLFGLLLIALNGMEITGGTLENGFRIYRLENCMANLSVLFTNVSFELKNQSYTIRFDIDVLEDDIEDVDFHLSIDRCLNRAAPDTCEEYHEFDFPGFCSILHLHGPWSPIMDNMEPPYPCPPKKGKYIMKRSIIIKIEDLEKLRLERGYYFITKLKQSEMKTHKLLFCGLIEGQF
ncbi:hypothetical protein ABEB36_003692 [Hypothenemus hampei]|uniref:Uncharacterized protein n=1 Tax=Hypothenemus hampei TaxID=57062 RepID=A0ABD1F1E7_HYPHA